LSAHIPRKKPQAKKSPFVFSVVTAYELTPSEASQKTKPAQNHFPEATAIRHIKRHNVTISHNRIAIYYFISIGIERRHNRIAIYYFRSIGIERQSGRHPKISTSFKMFRQCNRKLKTASEPGV
jgi:hypothetical protein